METTYHYSQAQNPAYLVKWAAQSAKNLVKIFKTKMGLHYPVLVYSGMSGIGHATALSVALSTKYPDFKFGMMYVRKDGESSHGRAVEYNNLFNPPKKPFLVFVDDFTSSGSTLVRVMGLAIAEFADNFTVPAIAYSYRKKDRFLTVTLKQIPDNLHSRDYTPLLANYFDHECKFYLPRVKDIFHGKAGSAAKFPYD